MLSVEEFAVTEVTADDHVRGRPDAPVTVLEYGDYECPYCRGAARDVQEMLARYPDTVRFVFRNFPIAQLHPHAELAAEAAEAAGAQGKFWPMHDLLFENQLHLKAKSLREYAEEARLDLERYDYEMSDHVYLQRVLEHIEGGARSSVRSTPTFFVNGVICDVSFGLEHLQQAIEAEL